MNIKKEFLSGLINGKLMIHPTDTIPGITYDPSSEEAFESLCKIKSREMSKTCIGLVNSFDMASCFFKGLSTADLELLKKYWPAPLSVVAMASSRAPASMVRDDGSISLRFPNLAESHRWLYQVIDALAVPLPTTSINQSGEPAACSWIEADSFAESESQVINLVDEYEVKTNAPSTIARINNGKFIILRQGLLELDPDDVEV